MSRTKVLGMVAAFAGLLGAFVGVYSAMESASMANARRAADELPLPPGAVILAGKYETTWFWPSERFKAWARVRLLKREDPAAVLRRSAKQWSKVVKVDDHLYVDGEKARFQYFPSGDYYEYFIEWP
jgi:hypothetical protein